MNSAAKYYAKGRMREAGAMNGLEKRYGAYLEEQRVAGAVLWYRFEAVKLRLADASFYTPDFVVMTSTGELRCDEVKGGLWLAASRTKIKVAAEMFPFHFVAVTANRVKDGGGFTFEEF